MSLALAAAALAATAAAPRPLTELRSVAQFRQRFNADAGKVRLVLLMSPT
ncbi:MAG TPA: hypothetical protein VGQ78_10645 [Vicinamibacteria bacterium]|nr:hypothetical protein [Vicinamibacteria bacterium]